MINIIIPIKFKFNNLRVYRIITLSTIIIKTSKYNKLKMTQRGLNVRIDCDLLIGDFYKEKYTNYKISSIIPIINEFLETKLSIQNFKITRNIIWNMLNGTSRCSNKLLINFIKLKKHIESDI